MSDIEIETNEAEAEAEAALLAELEAAEAAEAAALAAAANGEAGEDASDDEDATRPKAKPDFELMLVGAALPKQDTGNRTGGRGPDLTLHRNLTKLAEVDPRDEDTNSPTYGEPVWARIALYTTATGGRAALNSIETGDKVPTGEKGPDDKPLYETDDDGEFIRVKRPVPTDDEVGGSFEYEVRRFDNPVTVNGVTEDRRVSALFAKFHKSPVA